MMNEYLYVEKYRPKTITECILPNSIKNKLQTYVKSGDFPNLLLYGKPGSGKTTAARALCDEIGLEYLFINSSNENGIDILRTKITQYVTSVSLTHAHRKIVILDEADNLSPAIMSALRSFIEQFSSNAGFIFTCNYKNKIIEPLRSRLVEIEFNLDSSADSLKVQYLQAITKILTTENVNYDPKVVAKLVNIYFPDFRKILNEIQGYSVGGNIDTGIFANIKDANIDVIMDYMRNKDFRSLRMYFDTHTDSIDPSAFYSDLYSKLDKYLVKKFIPEAILIIAEYEYQSYFTINKKINLVAMCTRLMVECEFNEAG